MHDPTAAGTEPRRDSPPRRSDGRHSNGRLLPRSAAVGTVRITSAEGKIRQCGVPFRRPSGLRLSKFRAIARIRHFSVPVFPRSIEPCTTRRWMNLEIQEACSNRIGSRSSKTNVDRGAPEPSSPGWRAPGTGRSFPAPASTRRSRKCARSRHWRGVRSGPLSSEFAGGG